MLLQMQETISSLLHQATEIGPVKQPPTTFWFGFNRARLVWTQHLSDKTRRYPPSPSRRARQTRMFLYLFRPEGGTALILVFVLYSKEYYGRAERHEKGLQVTVLVTAPKSQVPVKLEERLPSTVLRWCAASKKPSPMQVDSFVSCNRFRSDLTVKPNSHLSTSFLDAAGIRLATAWLCSSEVLNPCRLYFAHTA
jgi:hypothetical protein